ncbi:MAG: histone deacetylase family protein [Gaiellales bacterium]
MSPLFEAHDPGRGHPERPARYIAVAAAVASSGAPVREASPAPREALERVHPAGYLRRLHELSLEGGAVLDPDTVMGEVSYDAAVTAAGAAVQAVEAVLSGELRAAFCAGRPPGHHAEPARPMGFCFINHAAVAAAHARALGCERVAILDWDAHHGNGTQAVFYDDPSVLYVSLHQWPYYPWTTGAADERGLGAGEGATLNIPLAAGTDEPEYLDAFRSTALPAVRSFEPQLLIVSAGFDAHRDDPLCDLGLSAPAFGQMTAELRGIAAGPVLVLEGGYDLAALEASVGSVLEAVSS